MSRKVRISTVRGLAREETGEFQIIKTENDNSRTEDLQNLN